MHAAPAARSVLQPRHILLASHGTPGARAADGIALALVGPGATLFHLTVVPDFWRGMMGDDWLNNVATREAYCNHVETQLTREIECHRQDLGPRVLATGARYQPRVVIGKPTDCLLVFAVETEPHLVVIGSPRRPGMPGLRSRIQFERLIKALAAPLLVAPYPQ